MPTPCPHPRPVATAAPCRSASENQSDGIVTGSVAPCAPVPGYRPGSRHGAHAFTAARNDPTDRVTFEPWPETVMKVPDFVTVEIDRWLDHSPASRRKLVRSP